jgi:hypothetical protein
VIVATFGDMFEKQREKNKLWWFLKYKNILWWFSFVNKLNILSMTSTAGVGLFMDRYYKTQFS